MGAGVRQTPVLLQVFFHRPVKLPPADGLGVGGIQKDEHIGVGDALPHAGNIGMFLGDVAQVEAAGAQPGDQGGLA